MDKNSFSLKGKIALVTGASYGIGFAIAKGFAAAGATIVFNDIKEELVEKGLASYKECGIEAHGYVCDVTKEDQVNDFVAKVEKEHEERYRKLAENVETAQVFAKAGITVWVCRNCGHVHIGEEAPKVCPVCFHPQAYFEVKANNF